METVLGFDLRKCCGDYLAGFWLNQRRHEYLLRPDVRWPLSVDPMVWPSFFDLTSRAEFRSKDAICVDPVTTIQLAVKLWDDRARMERTLRDEVPDGICFVPVAVGLCLDHDAELDDNWSFLQGSTPVASDLHGWTVLGYDVADRYLLSGLMNCGYSEQDRADLAGWAKRLNEFGLFERIEDAARFQDLTDRRVPEHAPFFVYRLLADVPEKLIHELSRRQSR